MKLYQQLSYEERVKIAKLWQHLTRHKAKRGLRKSRGLKGIPIPHRVSIHKRPKEVENKQNFDHWEGDLMSFRKNTQSILVLRERQTMFIQSAPLKRKIAQVTAEKLVALMKKIPKKARKTLTLDNGGECVGHTKWLKTLGIKTYFCDS
jgi:IS30 family transposase